ncbi:unnamed protein product [Linum trigynum]|uniref:Mitochondrial protein n=1 Tax=Linum trigynum TaxID=586398 RepID=A0AAV2CK20_9ROSI
MRAPSSYHWQCLKRLLRYVCGTISYGLAVRRASLPLQLTAFSDSDWAGNQDDRTSTSAYLLYLGSTLISWRSQKQRTVSRSGTEAEYRAIAHATAELEWLQLQSSLPFSYEAFGTRLALCSSTSPSWPPQRPLCAQQLTDALTKPLVAPRFRLLRSKIGVVDTTSILRGRIRDKE